MEWNAFYSGLVGTTIPAFLVSVLMLYLNHRTSRALESHKLQIAKEMSELNSRLSRNVNMFALWHEKRVESLIEIYETYRIYLDWLRKSLYPSRQKSLDVTPMHEFFDSIQKYLVFFDDELRGKILSYQSDLLKFWNWTSHVEESNWSEVRNRLDYEIPKYLEKLREDINQYSDPYYKKSSHESE